MNIDKTPAADTRSTHRADALPLGTAIEGCEIVRVIADSSFAIVYLAREQGSERRYAIKEYLPVTLAVRSADGRGVALRAPEHAEAFERGLLAFAAEAHLLEHHTHPALLRVLRSWQAHGSIYRQMPWLDGDTLLNLRRGLAEPPDEAALRRLLFGLLGALQALHDAGEVHGAVSPGNILLLSDDRPVLLDTGAVGRALVADQTRALMALVSPGFAPRARVADVGNVPDDPSDGPAADLHALAAVAHFCISGTLPAAGARHEPLTDVLRTMRPKKGRAAYGASLLDAIDAALSDDISRRPRTAAAFRASLAGLPDPARAAEPTSAAPASATAAAARPTAPAPPRAASTPAPVSTPMSAAGYRSQRSAGLHERSSQRLVWWSVAGFMALLAGGASLVAMKESAMVDLRSETITAPAGGELAPPSAQPLPVEPTRRAAGSIAPAEATAPPSEPRRVAPALTASPKPASATSKAAPEPKPAKPAKAAVAAEPGTGSPREECGARTEFALYRCMRTECEQARWAKHAQCLRLRQTDSVE